MTATIAELGFNTAIQTPETGIYIARSVKPDNDRTKAIARWNAFRTDWTLGLITSSGFNLESLERNIPLEHLQNYNPFKVRSLVQNIQPEPLHEIASRQRLIILPALFSIFTGGHYLIIDLDETQFGYSERACVIANSLAEYGYIIGYNPEGCNNSKGVFHIQVADVRGTGARPRGREEFRNRWHISQFEEAQRYMLEMRKFFSIQFLGNEEIGIIEHRLPLTSNNSHSRNYNSSIPISSDNYPFPLHIDITKLTDSELNKLKLYMNIGPACIEAASRNLVVDRNHVIGQNWTPQNYLNYYDNLFIPQ